MIVLAMMATALLPAGPGVLFVIVVIRMFPAHQGVAAFVATLVTIPWCYWVGQRIGSWMLREGMRRQYDRQRRATSRDSAGTAPGAD